jgi:hypothetical protein
MMLLLDENLPRKLAGHLIGHTCRIGVVCGWSVKKNGELMGLIAALERIQTRKIFRVGSYLPR